MNKKVPGAPPPEDVPAHKADAPAAADDEATRSPRSSSPTTPVAMHAGDEEGTVAGGEAGAAAGDAVGAEDTVSRPGNAVDNGKRQKGKANPKRQFSLEVEQEERLLEWMTEHEEVWRRGHRLYKKRNEIWGAKAADMGVSVEHILGWWKSVKDWYVRLNKVKSGQAAKKYTDREQFILDNCKFYKTQLPSTSSAPMVNFQMSEPALRAPGSESEPDSDQEQAAIIPLEDLEVVERTSAEAGRATSHQPRPGSSSRPNKKRKGGEQEEEWMKDLRKTMKAILEQGH